MKLCSLSHMHVIINPWLCLCVALSRLSISEPTNNNNIKTVKTQNPESSPPSTISSPEDPAAKRAPSPTILNKGGSPPDAKESIKQNDSPNALIVQQTPDKESGGQRSVSPTLLLIQEEEAGLKQKGSARYEEQPEGMEYPRYQGYQDPTKQSRSFLRLTQGLTESEAVGRYRQP